MASKVCGRVVKKTPALIVITQGRTTSVVTEKKKYLRAWIRTKDRRNIVNQLQSHALPTELHGGLPRGVQKICEYKPA